MQELIYIIYLGGGKVMNLKMKLTLLFSLLSATILLVSSVAGYMFTKEQVTTGIQEQMHSVVNAHVNKLDGWLVSKAKMLEITAGTLHSTIGDGEITVPMLGGYKQADKELSDLYVGMADGKMIDGSGWAPPADYDPRTRVWYKKAAEQGKLVFTDPYLDLVTKQMAVSVAMPVKNTAGQTRGVMSADILLQTLVDNTKDIKLYGEGYAFILDSKGIVLAHPEAELLSKNILEVEKLKPLAGLLQEMINSKQGFKHYTYEGIEQIVVFQKVPSTDWSVCISVPTEVVYKPLRHLQGLFAGIALIAIVIVIGITLFVANRITKPLTTLASQVQLVANGDLTVQAEVSSKDEIATLAGGFNAMVHKLRELIVQVQSNSEQVAASSEELTASAQQSGLAAGQVAAAITEVAESTAMQLNAANETTAIVQQMANRLQQVTVSVHQATGKSAQVADAAKDGSKLVEKAVNQMATIERTVSISAEVVGKLGERSMEIGQIVDTISGIAGQTNLLALNAAIEAARAGEQGRGFAVVSEEVRKLAEQSQEAAKQISTLIAQIQGDTNEAVIAMNNGTNEVKIGAEVVNGAGTAFQDIAELVTQVSEQVQDVVRAIEQMAGGSQEIIIAVRDIDNMSRKTAEEAQTVSAATEEQAASMEEIAAASQSLAHMAGNLQAAVSKFRV